MKIRTIVEVGEEMLATRESVFADMKISDERRKMHKEFQFSSTAAMEV